MQVLPPFAGSIELRNQVQVQLLDPSLVISTNVSDATNLR